MKYKYNITNELVFAKTSDELYFSDVAKFAYPEFDEEKDYSNYTIHETNPKRLRASFTQEVNNIDIKEMELLLAEAKKANATHVGIFYHIDHAEYEVYGYNVHPETTEEIIIRESTQKVIDLADKEVAKLKIMKYAIENGLNITFE